MRVVDLSHPVRTGMQVFPGDPQVRISGAASVPADGFEVAELHLGSHSGTHLDAPRHTVAGGAGIDELPLEWLIGQARIVRLPEAAPHSTVSWSQAADQLTGLAAGTIVLFETGFSRWFGTERYLSHPVFDADIARILVAAGVRVVGFDTLNPDPTPDPANPASGSPDGASALPFHDVFLGAGGAIIENLANLAEVTWPDPQVSVLPLRLAGVDGSPVRAAAFGA